MRRKESVEQNKNRRKNLMTHLTSDIEASGESSFWCSSKKFYDLDEIVPQEYMKQKKKKKIFIILTMMTLSQGEEDF